MIPRISFLQTGPSLVWVAILGLIFLYLYALVGFGLFRASFDNSNDMYCKTLYQCAVTIIRYGLVGDIDEVSAVDSITSDKIIVSLMQK